MSCPHELVTGIEQRTGACVQCLQSHLAEREQLRAENVRLETELKAQLEHKEEVRKILKDVALQKQAEKDGQQAQSRGATLEDNPHDKDSDAAACWSYGWLSTELSFTIGKMQAVMLFAANMLAIVRDVAAGGASGDEVAAKLDTVIDKLAPFITPEEVPAAE